MVDNAARGVILPGLRSTQESIKGRVDVFALHGGAADVPAFFDYSVLSVAFPPIWRPRFDRILVEGATELFDTLVKAGANPGPAIEGGEGLFDELQLQTQSVLTVGLHPRHCGVPRRGARYLVAARRLSGVRP